MKKAADPYYLNPPGSSRGPDKPDSVVPHWDARAGRYAAPWVMGPTNARIVRKSNAMLGDKYGAAFQLFVVYAGHVCCVPDVLHHRCEVTCQCLCMAESWDLGRLVCKLADAEMHS